MWNLGLVWGSKWLFSVKVLPYFWSSFHTCTQRETFPTLSRPFPSSLEENFCRKSRWVDLKCSLKLERKKGVCRWPVILEQTESISYLTDKHFVCVLHLIWINVLQFAESTDRFSMFVSLISWLPGKACFHLHTCNCEVLLEQPAHPLLCFILTPRCVTFEQRLFLICML